jgi:outer membrane protein TolC
MMKTILTLFFLAGSVMPVGAQTLTLDSCRAMALRNNKQLNIAKLNQDVAANLHKAARTKYLPKLDVLGGYDYYSKEISLLNKDQKSALSNFGTNVGSQVNSNLTNLITGMVQQGVISQDVAKQLGQTMSQMSGPLTEAGNALGQQIRDAFRTDTRNIWAGSAMVRQPVYMGGAIVATNRIAKINEDLASNDTETRLQNTIYNTDQAYWTVVSLKHKLKLANQYLDLVKKLDDDVNKMIKQGVATRADGLRVDVKVNEAEMTITQVEDGLSLSKMFLCQLCGLPIGDGITLADEDKETLPYNEVSPGLDINAAMDNRPELKMLQNAVDISKQSTTIVRAAFLPQVLLTGGYTVSNPNVFNGFERKFSGVWNVGIMVRVPVWNWNEGVYKVRASKTATSIAALELSDAREKVELQINQSNFRVHEAFKKLALANKNTERAEENLRCANLGFKEGVMETTDVMAAQTAWQEAQSQKIDAEIDVKLTQVYLKKALGILQ